jgi:hypothetical protein
MALELAVQAHLNGYQPEIVPGIEPGTRDHPPNWLALTCWEVEYDLASKGVYEIDV